MTVYAHINTVPNGSTGGIMLKEHRELLAAGHQSFVFWGRGRAASNDTEYRFATDAEVRMDVLWTRLDDRAGFHSKAATRRLLAQLDEVQPDVVHLHNLHGYYLNIEMLFRWLSQQSCRILWTLHDCWAFTGHCSYEKKCPQLREYPKTIGFGACKRNFEDKRRLFTSVPPERMTLITPSQWLANLVKESFLADYPVEVRHNEIDRTVFKPTPSDFRERYGIGNRFMILGVASPWTERKGLKDFLWLAAHLDERYAIVLVGLSKQQIKKLPKNIIGMSHISSSAELAKIYSTADIFVNPSIEETYGMTVAEAAACGTPVVVRGKTACIEAANEAVMYTAGIDVASLKACIISAGGGCVVVAIEKTDSMEQLAAVYSTADFFFNPTHEDNFPTVNLEAEACKTPVWTYNTGGCAETISLSGSKVLK